MNPWTEKDISVILAAAAYGIATTLNDTAVRALNRPLTESEIQATLGRLRKNLETGLTIGVEDEGYPVADPVTLDVLRSTLDALFQRTERILLDLNSP